MSWDTIFQERKEITEPDSFIKDFYKKYKSELKNSKILDLGCGTGRHTIFFAEKGLKIYAQDKSELALNLLKEQIKKEHKIKTIKDEINKIPFPNQFLDVVISTATLHHGKKKQIKNWFREIMRVLKPNGFLIISILSRNDRGYDTGEEIESGTKIDISDIFDTEIPHHFFTKKEIINLLKDFSILEINETESSFAKNYKKFKHWDIIARFQK